MLFYTDLKRSHSNPTGNGVPPECGAVFARLDCQHYLVIAQHCWYLNQTQKRVRPKTSLATQHVSTEALYRVGSSRKSFAQQHDVGADFLVVHSQPAAGPRQPRLHLISDPENLGKTDLFSSLEGQRWITTSWHSNNYKRVAEKKESFQMSCYEWREGRGKTGMPDIITHIVFGAKLPDCGQVAWVRHHHPSFTLDGLHHESCGVWVLKGFLEKKKRKTFYICIQYRPANINPPLKLIIRVWVFKNSPAGTSYLSVTYRTGALRSYICLQKQQSC